MEKFYRTHNEGLESMLSSDPSVAMFAHFGFQFQNSSNQSVFYFG
jgi:hypothetical protein